MEATQEVARTRRLGNLVTPIKIQKLQSALQAKAKEDPAFRFYALYDKVCRVDVLAHAYACCRAKHGAAGVDQERFEDIEAYGVELWIEELAQALRNETYASQPVRRVYIPKPNGTQRPLGIPAIRDRVVQMAVVLVLGPIFEPDLPPEQYAYRRQRSALQAVQRVHKLINTGHRYVIDADLSSYLDPSSHYTSVCGLLAEEIGKSRRYLDSQAFSSPAAHVQGVKFAALYTLQDGLARDAEQVGGFEHRHITVGRILHEARAQFLGQETKRPWRLILGVESE